MKVPPPRDSRTPEHPITRTVAPAALPAPSAPSAFAELLRTRRASPSAHEPSGLIDERAGCLYAGARERLASAGAEPAPEEVGRVSDDSQGSAFGGGEERGGGGDAAPSPIEAPIVLGAGAGQLHAPASAASAPAASPALAELFSRLVAGAAMGGDARRASLRLELGSSRRTERGHVTVVAGAGEVEIEVVAPSGVDAARLEARVSARLAEKGLTVTRFDVR